MNYEQANAVKKLAPTNYKVLKGLDIECPVCRGIDIRNKVIESCSCGDTGKAKWKWQPQVGEWCIVEGKVRLIHSVCVDDDLIVVSYFDYPRYDEEETAGRNYCTPILSWETIGKVLEQAGYYFEEPIRREYGSEGVKYHCIIKRKGNPKPVGCAWGDSYQEVVMLSVIELGQAPK